MPPPIEQQDIAACPSCTRMVPVRNLLNNIGGFRFVCLNCADILAQQAQVPEHQLLEQALNELVDQEVNMATPKKDTAFISTQEGSIIKSKRKFGVEFEVNLGREGQVALRDSIVREFSLVHDGSVNNGIEIVSPICAGGNGEKRIVELCDVLKKVGADADDSCGFHTHLDAADYFDKSDVAVISLNSALAISIVKGYEDSEFIILDANTIKDLKNQPELYERIVNRAILDPFSFASFDDYYKSLDKLQVVFSGEGKHNRKAFRLASPRGSRGSRLTLNDKLTSKAAILKYTGEPCLAIGQYSQFAVVDPSTSGHFATLVIKRGRRDIDRDRVERLKRVAGFYLSFDDVVASMLPVDRRDNRFTKRIDTRTSISDIANVNSILDFFNMWTKTKTLREFRETLQDNRHPSRYYGVNFRALIKHGTIEIRYHAGTTNAEKTLHWVALHQAIIDMAADLTCRRFNLDRLEKASMIIDIDQKTDLFFRKLGLAEATEKFMRARIKKFKKEDNDLVGELMAEDN